ncbi:MAG: hypothetical protein HY275_03155 [Gemmatimonadetes bacterium]|nr:hypothetical protein [Gemmatimonadota bacterium]
MSRFRFALASLALVPAALAAQQGPVPFPEKLPNIGYQSTFARVGPNLLIAGQPTDSALRALKAQGVTTVITLRTQEELDNRQLVPFEEEKLVKELGMTWVHIPVRGDSAFPYSPAAVEKFAAAMKAAKGRVLLHCTVAYRASHIYTAYLVKYRGLALDSAQVHGRAINLGGVPLEGFLGTPLEYAPVKKKGG